MKKLTVLLSIIIFPAIGLTQPCPDELHIHSQAQLDSFQIIYPGCTEIKGDVFISEEDIINLNALSSLTSVGGHLCLFNTALNSLAGLENLTYIGGSFCLVDDSVLTSLMELQNLTFIGDGLYLSTTLLTSLSGLENLTSVQDLRLTNNDYLTSLAGLENINANSIDSLFIRYNMSLSNCEVLSVCNYLGEPDGYVDIMDNAPGCNSPGEVQDSCIANNIFVEEMLCSEEFSVFPNPCAGIAHLRYLISDERLMIFDLYQISGNKIRRLVNEIKMPGEYEIEIDVSDLPAGVYFIRMQAGDESAVRRLVKIYR